MNVFLRHKNLQKVKHVLLRDCVESFLAEFLEGGAIVNHQGTEE